MMHASNSVKISAVFWITIIISTLLLLQLFQPILDSWIFGENESLATIQVLFLAPIALQWLIIPAIWYIVHGEGIGLQECREADYFKIFLNICYQSGILLIAMAILSSSYFGIDHDILKKLFYIISVALIFELNFVRVLIKYRNTAH